MNIYIEHNAAMLARLGGANGGAPHCDGLIVRHGKIDDVLAATIRANPLGDSFLIDLDLPAKRIVTWSGTLSEDVHGASPMTWMRPGREKFEQFCNELAPQLKAHDRTICFQPHSRHVLSDVQSCVNFLREQATVSAAGGFEIALSPATMFEPSMLRDADDHLHRMFETLGERCAMVFLDDVKLHHHDDEPYCEAVPLGEGALPQAVVLDLIEKHVSMTTPIVLQPRSIASQLAWLRVG